MIDSLEVLTVYIGDEVLGSGSWYAREDFICHVKKLSIGKCYLFGFNRNSLCRVDNFDTETGEVWLTQVLNLDEHEVVFEPTTDTAKYQMQVNFSDLPVPC